MIQYEMYPSLIILFKLFQFIKYIWPYIITTSNQIKNIQIINKYYVHFYIQIYQWNTDEKIKIKIFPSQTSLDLQTTHKTFYQNSFFYDKMPTILLNNFENIQQIYEEIRVTSKDKFIFKSNKLQIKLQIGSKFKTCQFQLFQSNFTYEQQIQQILWQTQFKLQKSQIIPEHPYLHKITQLNLINQRHTRQITTLHQKISQEKERKVELQVNLQQQINQMRIQIFEMKMYYEELFNSTMKGNHHLQKKSINEEEASFQPQFNHRVDQSSLICQEKKSLPEIINIQEETNEYNTLQKTVQRFHFDKVNISDIQLSYKRFDQRLIFKKYDNRSRQFNSIIQLQQPLCLINFKLIRTHEHNIYVGLLLFDRVRLVSTRRDKGAISYKLKGELFEDGIRIHANIKKVSMGQTLSVCIDGSNKRVRWFLQKKLIIDRILPFTFNGKQLYPFVNMVNESDQVQII